MARRKKDNTLFAASIAIGAGILSAGLAVAIAISSELADPVAEPPGAPSSETAADPAPSDDVVEAPSPAPTEAADRPASSTVQPASTAALPEGAVIAEILAYQDAALTFEATFPAGARNDAVLSGLRDDATLFLENMKSNAQMAYSADIADGLDPNPWDFDITWRETARAGDIASFAGDYYSYTGGAHGNVEFETLIANTSTGERLDFSDLFLPGKSPSPAFVIALCEAIKTEKTARIGEAEIYGEPVVCIGPGANAGAETPIVALAPSTTPDKFGGASIYYPPYTLGPYAEGPYVLSIPHGVFAIDLRPQYADLFGGELVERED